MAYNNVFMNIISITIKLLILIDKIYLSTKIFLHRKNNSVQKSTRNVVLKFCHFQPVAYTLICQGSGASVAQSVRRSTPGRGTAHCLGSNNPVA